MNLDTFTRAKIAEFAIEQGARYGGINNMLGVAQVLRNRVFSGWGDWLEVAQTAPAKCATIYPPDMPNMRTGNVRTFLNRLDELYTSEISDDLTGGALFYLDPSFAIAPWFQKEVLDCAGEHQRTAHIGPVWFYK
jgi:hypothetical protein